MGHTFNLSTYQMVHSHLSSLGYAVFFWLYIHVYYSVLECQLRV